MDTIDEHTCEQLEENSHPTMAIRTVKAEIINAQLTWYVRDALRPGSSGSSMMICNIQFCPNCGEELPYEH